MSVTSRCSMETAKELKISSRKKRRTTARTLVFWCQKSSWNSNGVAPTGAPNTRAVGKICDFDKLAISQKKRWKANRKTYASYLMVTLLMTFSDPSHQNSSLFLRFLVFLHVSGMAEATVFKICKRVDYISRLLALRCHHISDTGEL